MTQVLEDQSTLNLLETKTEEKASKGPEGAVGALGWVRSAAKNIQSLRTRHSLVAITLDAHREWTPYTLARVAFDLRACEALLLSMAAQARRQADYLGGRHGYAPAASVSTLATFEEAQVVDAQLRAEEVRVRAVEREARLREREA
jgi:hypothetical protein